MLAPVVSSVFQNIGAIPAQAIMFIIAIAWVYVVLLMSLTEHSVTAGVMTFLFYCVVPLSIILYLIGTPRRRRARKVAQDAMNAAGDTADSMNKPAIKSNTPDIPS